MKMPEKNLCTLDRVARGVVGIVTVYFGLFGGELVGDPIVQGVLVAFGTLNLISLLTGWCMVYQMASLNTLK